MAPRVQVDTSALRRLNPKTAVVARPVDTMVSVSNQVQQNSKLMQTANALAQVNPKLTQYLQDGQIQRNEEDQEEGTAAWQKANDEEKKAYLKAIKSGKIDEVESPFFIKGMSKGVLRDRARDYGQQLVIGWNAQKGTKGFNLDKFLSESKEAYIKEHGLDGFADNIFNSEFGRLAEAYGNQVSQRNYEDRLKKTRQARLTLLGKDVVGSAAKATSNNGTFNATTYIAEVNKVMEQAISEGLDPTNSRQQVLAQLEALATSDVENSKAYIDAAAQLSTRYGKYGETGKGALWVAEKNEFFENKAERDADDDWQETKRAQSNAIMDATQAMHKSIVEDPDYLNTKVGQFALDTMAGLRGGGGEKAQQFRDQHEHDAKVITDPAEYNAAASSIQSGAGNIDEADIDAYPNISGEGKLALKQMLGAGARLATAQSRLGSVDYVTILEQFATKRDANDPMASILGTVANDYSYLGMEAREAATEVVLEADRQFDLLTADGRAKARTYISEQFQILKKDIEDQRTEIRGKELQGFDNSVIKAGGLPTQEGGSLNKTTAETASGAGVIPEALPIYTYLPPSALDNPAVEAKRPVSKILPKKYDTFTTGPILEFTNNAEIQSLMQQYQDVFKNPEQPFSESRLVNMAMQYGVTVDELGTQIASQMAANLEAKIEEEDRERRIKEEDAAMNADFPQPTTMNEPYSVEGSDPNAQTLLETVSEAVAPYVSGTGETDEAMFKASDSQFFDTETEDTGEAMFEASGGQFFNDGEGTLTEQAVGAVAEAASDLVAPYVSGTGERYDNEAMFEASDGQFFDKGTVELPPSIQGGLLSQEDYDAMSVDAQQRADEKATAIQAEAIGNVGSTRDRIGDINTVIVDLGEGFVKAVARSFEVTGKAGAANAAKLLVEELDPDKALAAAQKYLSPEAKIRIQNVSKKFGSQKAADAALVIAQQYLSDTAKTRIDTGETGQPVSARANKVIADEDQVMNAAFPQPQDPQPKVSNTATETVNSIRSVVNLTGKVPSLSSMGQNLPKRAAWKEAFGANFRPNGAAKPIFIRKALDISKATDTDVTAVIKAVMGKEQTAEQLFVTSGLSIIEARKLYEKNQEIRNLFKQMNKDN